MASTVRHARLLDRHAAVLVVIDVQESYRSVLHEYERTAHAVATLVQGAAVLGVPMLATEQYPKGLGHTVEEVGRHFPRGQVPIEKRTLSCCGSPAFLDALAATKRHQVIVAGLETHACVNQTVHDLLAAHYQVHVPRDATSSRREQDAAIAWAKMLGSGAIPATVESVLLELLRSADAPEFKTVQGLIR